MSGDIAITQDVPVTLRDGTALVADVYTPAPAERHPAILVRTPYGKRNFMNLGPTAAFDVLAAVRAGYVVVIQDARGCAGSPGEARLFSQEADDGEDSVAWVAVQPWSNGDVGLSGPSYLGVTVLQAALRSPPALRAFATNVTPAEYYESWTHQGGAFQLGFMLRWILDTAYVTVASRPDRAEERQALEAAIADVSRLYWTLPVRDLAALAPALDQLSEWLDHTERDEYWRTTAVNEHYDGIRTPGLHMAGWFDIFLKGSLTNFSALQAMRGDQRLIVAPWGHQAPNEFMGDVWFGRAANPAVAGLDREQLAFFDEYLKGASRPPRAPVRIFVMGANQWRDEREWPLARAVSTRFYLRDGDRLTRQEPDGDRGAEYEYNPHDPVPTVSGNTLTTGNGFFQGPRDRRAVEARADVLVYTSDPLESDLEVTGPLIASLHVATSALDTDFTVALVDVHPDGRAIGIADGILRLRYRDGFAEARLAEPEQVYRIHVDLVATSNVFLTGHCLRVEVSSSNFPRFDRNPNHGGVIADAIEADLSVARQRVFHDAARPSFVTLPIVP